MRVTASEWLVTGVLSPLMGSLLSQHPELAIELVADPHHVNLSRREADLAIRPRSFDKESTIQRSVGKVAFGLYASRAYLRARGVPRPGYGEGHVLIAMTEDVGDVARAWLGTAMPGATLAVRTNGRDAMRALALAGVGLACLARVVGDPIPGLELVATDPAPPVPTLWMGMHRDARSTPRVRAVARHLAGGLGAMREALCPVE